MDKGYIEVVRLLLESAPANFETPHFAMKGGTAINLFIEDLPRLSVDIDVVYTDHQATRDKVLKSISGGLDATRKRLTKAGLESEVSATKGGDEIKLFIRSGRNQVKVEVNHVFRGTVLPVEMRQLGNEARKLFTPELSAPVLAAPELAAASSKKSVDPLSNDFGHVFDTHVACVCAIGKVADSQVHFFFFTHRSLLRLLGLLVKCFHDRRIALASLRTAEEKPVLLITDLHNPTMRIEPFLQECVAIHPSLRILMATGFGYNQAWCFSSTPDRLLQKPFTPEELREAVEATLAK
jgi:CheY-like chemotaxis protein